MLFNYLLAGAMRDPEMYFELGFARGAHLNPSIGAMTMRGSSSGAALFERTTTAITRSFTKDTNASPSCGIKTCDSRDSWKSSRTSAFSASPLLWRGAMPDVRRSVTVHPNRSNGAHHHGNPSYQRNRAPQPSAVDAFRITFKPSQSL